MHARGFSDLDQHLKELQSSVRPWADVDCILPTKTFLCIGSEIKNTEVMNKYSIPILWNEKIWWLHVTDTFYFQKIL